MRKFGNKNIPIIFLSMSDFHTEHDKINHYDESGVICGPGSKELIYLTMNALETKIIILKPAWPTYMPQTKLANKKVLTIDRTVENDWKLTGSDLEENNFLNFQRFV